MDIEFLWRLIKIFRNASGHGRRGEGKVWGLTCKEDEGTLWSDSNVQYVGGVLDYTDDISIKTNIYRLKICSCYYIQISPSNNNIYRNIEFSSWYFVEVFIGIRTNNCNVLWNVLILRWINKWVNYMIKQI